MSYSNPAAYERLMGRWSAHLAPLFAQFAGIQEGQRVLDVGCGTGSLARVLLATAKVVSVVGVDPAEQYVAFAREVVTDSRATFQVAAAESLPFPDDSFDAAMALLVLQEFDDPGRAIREMGRTTRRGGTVAACLWDFQDGMPMFSLFWEAAEAVAPDAVARRRAEHPPKRPGLPALVQLWNGAGLVEVRTACLDLSQEFSSFGDFWLPFLTEATPTSAFAVAANRETRGELANALQRKMPRARPDGTFALPARALAVAGVVGR